MRRNSRREMWFVEGKASVRSKKTQEEEEEEESGEFVRRGEVRREGQSSATALEKLQEKRELRALARLNFGAVVGILVHILLRQSDLTSVKRCNAEQNLSENPGSVGVNLFKGGALCNISLFQT
ncbi:hypothetical protein HZH68_008082 [Vespula germanica]|uniref:Uncharacterized protein n=1 Tax=Vespula germanica TaxID=30212 RepID=A0A834K440_VESGE|nr:hypothetical protein HZH68_008082 [Vespula germanica]